MNKPLKKGGFDESNPYINNVGLINQAPTISSLALLP